MTAPAIERFKLGSPVDGPAPDRRPVVPLAGSPLLPAGFEVPASRWVHPATRFRELLRTEPYLFGPGVYDPMGAQLVMYHG